MSKHTHTNMRAVRVRIKQEKSIRYIPIAPVATDGLLERFFDYERRLAEIEDQLREASAVSTIDIDSL